MQHDGDNACLDTMTDGGGGAVVPQPERDGAHDVDLFELLEEVSISACVFDQNMRIRWLNRRARRWLEDQGQRGIIGQSWYDLYPEMVVQRPVYERVLAGEAIEASNTMIVHPDGKRYYDVRYQPLPRQGGMVAFALDVTERHRSEERRRVTTRMESLGRFAGGIVHDINNLLTAIGGYLDMTSAELDEEHPSFGKLRRCAEVSRDAQILVERLLDFARQRELKTTVESMSTLVAQVGDRLLEPLMRDDVSVTFDLRSAQDWVEVDASAIERVFVNLLVNARDAMAGGGEICVRTFTKIFSPADELGAFSDPASGEFVVLEVADNGPGMDSATLSRCFEPFFTTKRSRRSCGLGLSTCFGIVQQMNGKISVESEVGRGTTFSIMLPRARALRVSVPSTPVDDFMLDDMLCEERGNAHTGPTAAPHAGLHRAMAP